MSISVRPIARAQFRDHIDALAQLRIDVFRAWPYLYDGDAAYEASYLETYMKADRAYIAGAFDGQTLVGACTAAPMGEHDAAFAGPLREAGFDLKTIFYFGESVLLPAYRGQGIGVQFLTLREAEARRQGYQSVVFCAVERPPNHPARPHDYTPLDAFWKKRGYAPLEGIKTQFAWRDVGDAAETEKPMRYWHKAL
ncbi:MAG: GNAT family N-acetyltransferase [Ahrensia sp.]